jgi:hypothetical protein
MYSSHQRQAAKSLSSSASRYGGCTCVYREVQTNRTSLWLVAALVLVCAWAFSLVSSTTSYYSVDASSYFNQLLESQVSLTNDIIVAILTPLEWRGFTSSILWTPFIINTLFAGNIVNAIDSRGQCRWCYGMLSIVMPLSLTVSICVCLIDTIFSFNL